MLVQVCHDFLRHFEQAWTGQNEFTAKSRQGVAQRVDGTPVSQITGEDNLESVKTSVSLLDGEEVQHGLRRMMACTVTTVEDRYIRCVLRVLSCALAWMAHGDDVGVTVDHLNRVKQRLPFDHRGCLDIAQVDHITTKPFHGGFERHTGPRAGLEEEVAQNFSLKKREVEMAFRHG